MLTNLFIAGDLAGNTLPSAPYVHFAGGRTAQFLATGKVTITKNKIEHFCEVFDFVTDW